MYKIRPADEMDVEQLLVLLRKFHEESSYAHVEFNEEHAAVVLFELVDHNIIYVAQDDVDDLVGTIGWRITGFPFNEDVVVAHEQFFFIEKEHRKHGLADLLLIQSEAELREHVDYFVVSALSTSRPAIHRWYHKQGFEPVEMSYIKEV